MTPELTTRPPAVAGLFYPDQPAQLIDDIADYLDQVAQTTPPPKAIIVPHAGYIYSAAIAASAYAQLRPLRGKISKVILLGPAHRVYLKGLAMPDCHDFSVPIGKLEVDHDNLSKIAGLTQLHVDNLAHRDEHSLEVQLPFLLQTLGNVLITPLVVGDASANEVAEVIDLLWDEANTLVVISSDLSHYHEYHEARTIDHVTAQKILGYRYNEITYDMACGRNAVNGLLKVAAGRNMTIMAVDIRNSGDTAGTHDRVVGYGAFIVY